MARRPLLLYKRAPARYQRITVGLGVFAAIVLLAVLIQLSAVLVVGNTPNTVSVPDRLTAISNARNSLIQLLAACAVVLGGLFTARTYLLTRRTNRSDRFATAIANIGQVDSTTMRIGGLHTLRILCLEDPSYWAAVEPTLAAFLREASSASPPRRSEVQAALTVFRERPAPVDERQLRIDLGDLVLADYKLAGVHFERALLDGVDFSRSDLTDAHLNRASLIKAKFENADLSVADLTDADLTGALLVETELYRATVTREQLLTCGDLTGVKNAPN